MPGPVPKRSDQRRRRNKDAMGVTKLEVNNPYYEQPDPSPEWHPVALRWYESLAASGQSHYYEASDWQHAWIVAETLSREFRKADEDGKPLRAMMLQTVFSEMGNLMTTEGERRRLRLELARQDAGEDKEHAEVASIMSAYKDL